MTSLFKFLTLWGGMRGEILGHELRRRWSDDEKLAIVNSVGVGGATVTHVAQRHDIKRQPVSIERTR